MIQILHAAFVYQSPDGEVEALRDVSFDVQEGEFCSIVGPSGCGKSTLLSALAGLEPLTGGRVELKGEPVCGPSRKVGFMPQRDQLFEWRSIWGNVTLGLTVRGENTPQRQAHVRELLERYGYKQYEISNFCAPGYESRHNMKYWTLEDYMGFGPGAHSDFGGRRFACARDLNAYIAGKEKLSEAYCPPEREREEERVMLALRTARGLDLSSLKEDTAQAEAVLEECARHGLARKEDGGRWRLTPQGFLVSNAVIVRLLEALAL